MNSERSRILLSLARAAIAEEFGGPPPQRPQGCDWLDAPGAVFVSLHSYGELRGCVGSLSPRRSLFDEVLHSAKAAAFHDPRMLPLERAELPQVEIDLTVVHPLEPVPAADEEEAIARLRPGTDGVVLTSGTRSAVFIPKMWQQLPEPHEFLARLKHKAGLAGWPRNMKVQRFTADECSDAGAGTRA